MLREAPRTPAVFVLSVVRSIILIIPATSCSYRQSRALLRKMGPGAECFISSRESSEAVLKVLGYSELMIG